jgi:hypothetical protein
MPDAGDFVIALDFTDAVTDIEGTDETAFTDTAYALGGATTGQSFVAPTSGAVLVLWCARMQSNTASVFALSSAEVRTGATIGSGTVVSAASDLSALESGAADRIQASRHRIVTGLTAGSTYNVSLWHRVSSAGNATIFDRNVAVLPVPL